jgi:hypothetical protein
MGGGQDHVTAFAGVLKHRIGGIVDEVDVAAGAADHDVGARAAVEQVVAGIAVERIRQAVAITLQVGAALQDEGFDIRRQSEIGGREHHIGALVGVLDHGVAGIVDEIDIIAGKAIHPVNAGPAVQQVASGITVDRIARAVAVGLQIGAALQHQIFNVRRQPEVSGRVDGIDALSGVLDHGVAGVVDEVGIASGPAEELVRTAGSGEPVVPGVAGQRVAGAIDIKRVMVGTAEELVRIAGERKLVVAGIAKRHIQVAAGGDDVVAAPTVEDTAARTAVNLVVAAAAGRALDDRVQRDGDVVHHAVATGERPGV